ncbi:MAG TPA: Na-translocating system protein MpsC family protein [Solirubrobacteraceae bacterium]|nr:Na-translocating system protein MpsC family protein [Solirubrobacteraceae bacterium]
MHVGEQQCHHDEEERAGESVLSAISSEMVRLYKEQFGRGPTKTRTLWAGPDMLVVTLEQTFTPAERSLQRMGEHQRLRDLRLLFQYASVTAFCEPVERLIGRKVRAFVSGIDTQADLATEIYVLHPRGYEGPSRGENGDEGS